MKFFEEEAEHEGYWYSIGDVLTILVCGMLCGLQRIDDIHDWAHAAPPRAFLEAQFGITRTPCRAQFYNILRCVDAEKFNLSFVRWMSTVLSGSAQGKTRSLPARFFNETILRSPSISRRVETTATQEKTPSTCCLLNVYVLPGLFQ